MMIAILEPSRPHRAHLIMQLRRLLGDGAAILPCASASELMREIAENRVDMIFLQAETPGMRRTQLLEQLGNLQPKAKLVLIADSDAYALEAIRLHVHDYLITPVSDEKLLHAFTEIEPDGTI